MDIMEVGAIGELVGGVAVIATLAFLGFEVRRNSATIRRATQMQMVGQAADINLSLGESAGLVASSNEDYDTLSPPERIKLQTLYVNYFNLWDAAYWNHREGFLDDRGFNLWNNGVASILGGHVGSRRAWEEMAGYYSPEFRSHVDETIDQLGPVTGVGTLSAPTDLDTRA